MAETPTRHRVAHVLARAIALFFGLFSTANLYAMLRGAPASQDLWWVDLRFLPGWGAGLFGAVAAATLLAYGTAPACRPWRRRLTAAVLALLAGVATANTAAFYVAWSSGTIAPGVPVSFSALLALAFGAASIHVRRFDAGVAGAKGGNRRLAVAAVVLGLAVLMPLAQVFFFGKTDYRRPADVVVVLGAKVHADGRLSHSLENRVSTAVTLYEQGLVRRLVMSGGTGASGVDEALAMREYAVGLGVPPAAVLLDRDGVDTDATVRNTCALCEREGLSRILVVSQFYHLPRIKLAYLAAGREVYTVPAVEPRPIVKTPLFVAREVPAFWIYWLRGMLAVP